MDCVHRPPVGAKVLIIIPRPYGPAGARTKTGSKEKRKPVFPLPIYSRTVGLRNSSKEPESGQALCHVNYLRKSLRNLAQNIDFLRNSRPLKKCTPFLKSRSYCIFRFSSAMSLGKTTKSQGKQNKESQSALTGLSLLLLLVSSLSSALSLLILLSFFLQ